MENKVYTNSAMGLYWGLYWEPNKAQRALLEKTGHTYTKSDLEKYLIWFRSLRLHPDKSLRDSRTWIIEGKSTAFVTAQDKMVALFQYFIDFKPLVD